MNKSDRLANIDRRTAKQRADDVRLAAIKNEGAKSWAQRVMSDAEKEALRQNTSEFPHPPTSALTVLGPLKAPEQPSEPKYTGTDLREMGRQYDEDQKIVKAVKKEHLMLGVIAFTFLLLIALGLASQAYDYLSNLPANTPELPKPTATVKPTEKIKTSTPTPTRFSVIQQGNEQVVIPPNSLPLITRLPNGDKIIYAATYTPQAPSR